MPPNVQTPNKGEYVSRTFESMVLTGTQESSRRGLFFGNRNKNEATTIEDARGKRAESAIVTRTNESSEDSSFAHQKESKSIVIDSRDNIFTVALLADEKHVVSGGGEEKIQRWRMEDGRKVGTPMDAGSRVFHITVSRDEKWIVSGTDNGQVAVWNAENHSKVTEWKAHNDRVRAVDVSPDGTRIASGSADRTLCVWSLSTGERLLGPFKHDWWVVAVKFSPNGRLIATAAWDNVRVYDSQNGGLVKFSIRVNTTLGKSLAWASDSKQLFALSHDRIIHCLDVSTGTTLSKWAIHSSENPRCIALASNGTFIAVAGNSSISFWDTATHDQIGSVIKYTHDIWCMALSANYDLVIGGDEWITLQGLYGVLPHHYLHNVCVCA